MSIIAYTWKWAGSLNRYLEMTRMRLFLLNYYFLIFFILGTQLWSSGRCTCSYGPVYMCLHEEPLRLSAPQTAPMHAGMVQVVAFLETE